MVSFTLSACLTLPGQMWVQIPSFQAVDSSLWPRRAVSCGQHQLFLPQQQDLTASGQATHQQCEQKGIESISESAWKEGSNSFKWDPIQIWFGFYYEFYLLRVFHFSGALNRDCPISLNPPGVTMDISPCFRGLGLGELTLTKIKKLPQKIQVEPGFQPRPVTPSAVVIGMCQ